MWPDMVPAQEPGGSPGQEPGESKEREQRKGGGGKGGRAVELYNST